MTWSSFPEGSLSSSRNCHDMMHRNKCHTLRPGNIHKWFQRTEKSLPLREIDHRFNPCFSWQAFGEGSFSCISSPCFLAIQPFCQRALFLSSLHPRLIPECPSVCPFLFPCVGLRKECKTNGGLRNANGKWLLNKLKTAQNINSQFETIIWLKWRIAKLRIRNTKQLKSIYNVGWPEGIRRGQAGGYSIL